MSSEDPLAIVFDLGSSYLRSGFAGDDAPRSQLPPIVARSAFGQDNSNSTVIAVGDIAYNKETEEVWSKTRRRGVTSTSSHIYSILKNPKISTSSPIQYGRVTNWGEMEKLWHYCFYQELHVDPEETRVLSSEKSGLTKHQRETQTQIFFEKFQVPAYYVKEDTVLSMCCSGRTTGLCVDSGLNSTTVAPVYEGYLLPHAVKTCHDLGGSTVDLFFAKLMMESGRLSIPGGRSELKRTVRDMKHTACRFPNDGDGFDVQVARGFTTHHRLPDGAIVEDPDSCFYLAPECLFFPEILLGNNNLSPSSSRNKLLEQLKKEREDNYAMKQENPQNYNLDPTTRDEFVAFSSRNATSVHRAALSSIYACDVTIHQDLFRNIVLSGGNTMFTNFGDRLKERMNKEIAWSEQRPREWSSKGVRSSNLTVNRIIAPPERKISCWIGGSILASLSSFQQMWVTKEEYEENGPSIVHRKCF